MIKAASSSRESGRGRVPIIREDFNLDENIATIVPGYFKSLYRLSSHQFLKLRSQLRPHLARSRPWKKFANSTKSIDGMLCIMMRKLASKSYLDIGFPYSVYVSFMYVMLHETLKCPNKGHTPTQVFNVRSLLQACFWTVPRFAKISFWWNISSSRWNRHQNMWAKTEPQTRIPLIVQPEWVLCYLCPSSSLCRLQICLRFCSPWRQYRWFDGLSWEAFALHD